MHLMIPIEEHAKDCKRLEDALANLKAGDFTTEEIKKLIELQFWCLQLANRINILIS